MSSAVCKLAKKRYEAGLWPRDYVVQLYDAGRLTDEELAEILGADGPSPDDAAPEG